MLPLYLLTNAKGQQMRVELKNGEIVEGKLTNVDNWMNLTLSNVSEYKSSDTIATPQTEVVKSTEIYVRGTFIKYINLQDDIIDIVKQQINNNMNNSNRDRKYQNNRYPSSGSRGNYRRDGNYSGGNRRNYNNNNQGNRRSYNQYNNQNKPNSSAMGGYVQQHTENNANYRHDGSHSNQNVEF
ncbi:hypothetical protein NCAS_0A14510 [Naumovozyma castellii]|uniref:LSM complex subunit LSM4 n=1 Tax=Naumovozyma castellii TaxID=27288 RepID=G0V959_NAUCA|nr:hypothetical protein NCAS_0A14510 [Naumovozyma castellii CBS 4309]CCC68009.1 hypothetical protein NCAS_0A14510 [Naumovozyma castellii CBS 4309]